jgi:ElaB/YqjD/DUF883 family membrane-anchored ribosome-binding protein
MTTETERSKTGNGGKSKESATMASASRNIQDDVAALQADVSSLTQQFANIAAMKGNEAWQRARAGVDDLISEAGAKGKEATDAVREVRDNLATAIDDSIEQRPYTTLALALGLGFILGASWRR